MIAKQFEMLTSTNKNMIEIAKIDSKEIVKGYRARFIHTANTTLAFWDVDAGALLPSHSHMHEQSSQVIEGTFELNVAGEKLVCEKGFVVVIPSGTMHQGKAITDCKLLDVFSPVREDYK